jgi:hypothetical protein
MAPLGGTPLWVERPDGTRLSTVSLVPAGGATRATVVLAHGFAVDSRWCQCGWRRFY